MKILRTTNMRLAVRETVRALRRGDVIAFPTETTYGLGCDPRNAKAVARIFGIKVRMKAKPLPLVAASVAQVRLVADTVGAGLKPARTRECMSRHWPGPLTLVLPAHRRGEVTSPLPKSIALRGEVAIRVSSSPFIRAVCQAYGFPIVATSANRSGEPDCRSGRAVVRIFRRGGVTPPGRGNRAPTPDLIIDMGALPRRKPSTVARVREDGSIEVLRQGAVRLQSA